MTRTEMINFMLEHPYVHITHPLFDSSEYIYSVENGNIYDENGYLFEDWDAFTPLNNRYNGIRIRKGNEWQTGWVVKE
jgi:hypothetical protein